MDAGGRGVIFVHPVGDPRTHLLDQREAVSVEATTRIRPLSERPAALLGVERAPGAAGQERHRFRTDPTVALPALRRRAERRGAGVMGDVQATPEVGRGLWI